MSAPVNSVLLLCWRDIGHPQGGGSETYLQRIGAHLAASGVHVTLRTARSDGSAPREIVDGVEVQRRGGPYSVYVRAGLAMVAARVGLGPLRHVRPDVVVDLAAGGLQALTSSLSDFVAQTGKLQRASFDSEALQLGARRAASEDLTSPSSAALWDGSLVAPSGLDGAVVLLVIDRDPSSWAATVGAAKLREAGASIVLPLLLRRAAS